MILDWFDNTKRYGLLVPRGEADPHQLMKESGFDWSESASTPQAAVLFTAEPYAAVSFWNYATPRARAALAQLKQYVDESWRQDSDAHIRIPPDKELWGFQKAGVEYLVRRGGGLVGDQPGLGKTAQAIAYCNEIRANRVLVLCPANIRIQWVRAIREWTTMAWPYTIHPILNSRNGVHPTANWTVASYDMARTPAIVQGLAQGRYDVLILDEGHYLKTIDSRRTRAVFGGGDAPIAPPIADRAASIVALTGTPLPNRPREAYTLARGLCFDAIDWLSEEKFSERFNPYEVCERVDKDTGKVTRFTREAVGRTDELQNRMRANFMVRRLKKDVLPQLDLPYYDLIYVDETKAVKLALQAESLLELDPDMLDESDFEQRGHIAVVRRQMGIAMAPQVVNYVDMLIDGGEDKLVIFGYHIEVLNILQEGLSAHGLVRIDGSTSTARRQRIVDDFIAKPEIKVFIGNMQSVGTGTDGLQKVAWHALFAEASWTPGENEQCVDRLNRGGQQNKVQADFFVAEGSISERVLSSALRKAQTTHKALDARRG